MRNFDEDVRGYLFQGRFGSCVLDEVHFLAAVRYIERNPVRAGMATDAWSYEWSSARFHVGPTDKDPLVQDRTLLGLVDDWRAFLSEEDQESIETLRLSTRTGRPAGTEMFIVRVQDLTGRSLEKGKAGRPKKILPK